MINDKSKHHQPGGLNYVFSKNFLNFYLSSNIIAIAVTVYLFCIYIISFFIYFVNK